MNSFARNTDEPPPWEQEQGLLKWNSNAPWTIGESFEGVHAFGNAGCGKTSGSVRVNGGSKYELIRME